MQNPFDEILQRLDRHEGLLIQLQKNGTKQPEPLTGGDAADVAAVAAILQISVQSVYRLCMLRKLPHRKVGKKLYFSRKEIFAYIESGKRPVVFS